MSMKMQQITAREIFQLLRYERNTGSFFWVVDTSFRRQVGKAAGTVSPSGRRIIPIKGRRYAAERLVWLIEKGEIPSFDLDFIDGNKLNVAIHNLRPMGRPEFSKEDISQESLARVVDYSPETGLFTWRDRMDDDFKSKRARSTWQSKYAGRAAGHVGRGGYVSIRIEKKLYRAHRLAWLHVHGKWPDNVIDHINGDPTDNRIANLRDVTQLVNQQNMRKATVKNKLGILGVNFDPEMRKFVAFIRVDGKSMSLGYFATADAAGLAYLTAKRKYHEGCTI